MTEDKIVELTRRLDDLEDNLDSLRNKWEYNTFGAPLDEMMFSANKSFSYNYPIHISCIEPCMYYRDTLDVVVSYPDDNEEDYEKIVENYFSRNYDIDINIIREDN